MLLEISGPKSTASVLSAVEGNEASFNPLIFPSCLSPLYLVEDGDGPSCQCCYCMTRHAALTNTDMWLPDLCTTRPECGGGGGGGCSCWAGRGAVWPQCEHAARPGNTPLYLHYIYTISTLYTGHHIYTQGDTGPGPGAVTIIAGDTGQSGDTVTE